MLRISTASFLKRQFKRKNLRKLTKCDFSSSNQVPTQADVVVIGGGVAGCNLLYQLSKRGIQAVLLEQGKLTNGTTWHTDGLLWRLSRPSDVDITLLEASKNIYLGLEQDTGVDPGLVQHGGIFIARKDERLEEYKRLHTFAHYFDIDTQIISPSDAAKLSPILDPTKFIAALYSPQDGHIDPTMLCSSLVKGATKRGAQVIENCRLTNILTEPVANMRKITGIETSLGKIKTGCVVNSAGVWSRDVSLMLGLDIPLVPMKHAYIVTDSVPEVRSTPNIRDHDGNLYIKIQGDSINLGGYEINPEILKEVAQDFSFAQYELDMSIFEVHLERAKEICPIFNTIGIKSTVCGPESFTPDHKPLIGEDPKVLGLFYNCGYNSGGMQLSGGCAEQLAIWIATGGPEIQMFNLRHKKIQQTATNR
ncbi:hypothetical protein WA026_009504 [Henosepilachna vigintioctopunctata]|uniref:FAD dependent oxidoreductase domain-containing protein n=1 Tax=Henosepilachna vigintioctopunctata TaxID=420089 RepID=A0AAW1U4T9_9CUCU